MTALVTGAAGGIGRAGFDALQGHGLDVIGQDRDSARGPGSHLKGDLRDASALDAVEAAVQDLDVLDTVVAAHGIEGPGALHEIDPDYAREILETNFETVVNLWERVRPALERSHGSFVVIASQAGVVSEKGNALYCASKSALRGWLRTLDANTSVRLRALHPGGINTPLLQRALRGMAAARGTTYDKFVVERYSPSPAGRIADPKESGAAILWASQLQAQRYVEMAITGGEVLW